MFYPAGGIFFPAVFLLLDYYYFFCNIQFRFLRSTEELKNRLLSLGAADRLPTPDSPRTTGQRVFPPPKNLTMQWAGRNYEAALLTFLSTSLVAMKSSAKKRNHCRDRLRGQSKG